MESILPFGAGVTLAGGEGLLEGPGWMDLEGFILPVCGWSPAGGRDGELSGIVLGLVFGGSIWFLGIGGALGEGLIILGELESLMDLTGSGSPFFLGALGGGGDLAGDGEGDLTGESEKDLLLNEVLEGGAGESFGGLGDWDGDEELSLVFSGDSS